MFKSSKYTTSNGFEEDKINVSEGNTFDPKKCWWCQKTKKFEINKKNGNVKCMWCAISPLTPQIKFVLFGGKQKSDRKKEKKVKKSIYDHIEQREKMIVDMISMPKEYIHIIRDKVGETLDRLRSKMFGLRVDDTKYQDLSRCNYVYDTIIFYVNWGKFNYKNFWNLVNKDVLKNPKKVKMIVFAQRDYC